jgi:peptidoglycan/LPS O-acetylase OafA/YrhL
VLMQALKGRRAVVLTIIGFVALSASAVLDHVSGKYYILFADPAASLLVAACVLGVWFSPDSRLHRWLNNPALVAVGILSYSMYLWQQPFTQPSAAATWVGRWPQNVFVIFAAAAASYFVVERPFLKLKARLSSPRERLTTPSTPQPIFSSLGYS